MTTHQDLLEEQIQRCMYLRNKYTEIYEPKSGWDILTAVLPSIFQIKWKPCNNFIDCGPKRNHFWDRSRGREAGATWPVGVALVEGLGWCRVLLWENILKQCYKRHFGDKFLPDLRGWTAGVAVMSLLTFSPSAHPQLNFRAVLLQEIKTLPSSLDAACALLDLSGKKIKRKQSQNCSPLTTFDKKGRASLSYWKFSSLALIF